jgi:hypothetical protein
LPRRSNSQENAANGKDLFWTDPVGRNISRLIGGRAFSGRGP